MLQWRLPNAYHNWTEWFTFITLIKLIQEEKHSNIAGMLNPGKNTTVSGIFDFELILKVYSNMLFNILQFVIVCRPSGFTILIKWNPVISKIVNSEIRKNYKHEICITANTK